MSVYTRRLGVLAGSAPEVWLELFRVETDETHVVRNFVITNAGTTAALENALRVRPLTRAGEWWLWYGKDLPIGSTYVETRQVIERGEALEFFSSSTGLYVAVTGYVFQ